MANPEHVSLTRDVAAALVPSGEKVTLVKGEDAHITQALGSSYTIVVRGNMFRIDGQDADALGKTVASPSTSGAADVPASPEAVEQQMWDVLKTCYDPEIPVNIVDLGLVYDCRVTPVGGGSYRAEVKMTLTSPGCGMGPLLQQDAQQKIISLEGVAEANVELVWEPPWNQDMMTEAAKLQLGLL